MLLIDLFWVNIPLALIVVKIFTWYCYLNLWENCWTCYSLLVFRNKSLWVFNIGIHIWAWIYIYGGTWAQIQSKWKAQLMWKMTIFIDFFKKKIIFCLCYKCWIMKYGICIKIVLEPSWMRLELNDAYKQNKTL